MLYIKKVLLLLRMFKLGAALMQLLIRANIPRTQCNQSKGRRAERGGGGGEQDCNHNGLIIELADGDRELQRRSLHFTEHGDGTRQEISVLLSPLMVN